MEKVSKESILTVCVHNQADVFISKNSCLPIARIITQANGSGACELWEQPLEPGDIIPMHYHLIEETITFFNGTISVILDGTNYEINADRDGTSSILLPSHLHHEIRNIGAKATNMLAFFPAINPQIFPINN